MYFPTAQNSQNKTAAVLQSNWATQRWPEQTVVVSSVHILKSFNFLMRPNCVTSDFKKHVVQKQQEQMTQQYNISTLHDHALSFQQRLVVISLSVCFEHLAVRGVCFKSL